MNPLTKTVTETLAMATPVAPPKQAVRVVCRSQAELREALSGADARIDIVLRGNSQFTVSGSYTVRATEKVSVRAREKSRVIASDWSKIEADDHTVVIASDNCMVTCGGFASVAASDFVKVHSRGNSQVHHSGTGRVYIAGNSRLISTGDIRGAVTDSARCEVYAGELVLDEQAKADVVEGGVVEVYGMGASAHVTTGGHAVSGAGGQVFLYGEGTADDAGGCIHRNVS